MRKESGANAPRVHHDVHFKPRRFQPLDDYEWPALPTERRLERFRKLVVARFRRDETKPYVPADQLERATIEALDDVAAPPACEPLKRELSRTLDGWIADATTTQRTKLIVLPPCDATDLLESWACQEELEIVPPPLRRSLIDGTETALPEALTRRGGENRNLPPLVVPRLEKWFLRHAGGLETIRRLLAAIDGSERRMIVGCNSWAWAYLSKAVNADMVLPEPLTFHAFDADRLHDWLLELSLDGEPYTFRAAATGADVFERAKPDEDGGRGAIVDDTMRTLAAASLGIPWVAWNMWRRSLRAVPADDEETSDDLEALTAEDRRTLFVSEIKDVVLPERHERTALLMLQALLVHGRLTREELMLVLPESGAANMVAALLHCGVLAFEDVEDGEPMLRCREAAYPAVREGLRDLGFSMGRL